MPVNRLSVCDQVQNRNNFTIMRLIAATAVIWGHSFALTHAHGMRDPIAIFWGGQTYSGTIAVHMFFVISGFLVTRSMMTARSSVDFVLARILRIFPGLVVCNILIILVVGWLATDLPFSAYISNPLTEKYLVNNTLLNSLPSYNLPGAFAGHRYQSVNGSLWTLPGEVRLYVTLAGLLLIWPVMRMLRVPARIYFGLGCLGWVLICAHQPLSDFLQNFASEHPVSGGYLTLLNIYPKYLALGLYFFAGGLLYVLSPWIVLHWGLFLAALAVFLVPHFEPSWTGMAHLFSLPYLTLYLAYGLPYVARLNNFGDFSYGIYIYGWPMQQFAVLMVTPTMSPHLNFGLATIMALTAAVLSWFLVEKPALKWRRPMSTLVQTKADNMLTRLKMSRVAGPERSRA